PLVIEFRMKKSRAAVARVQSMQAPLTGGTALDIPQQSASAQPVSPFAQPLTSYRIPVPAGQSAMPTLPRNGSIADIADQVMGRGAIDALKDQIRSLEGRLDEQTRINEDLNRRLLEETAQVLSGQKEVDLWRVKVVELQSQLSQAHQTADDLQQANDRIAKDNTFNQRLIASLQSDIADAHADLDVANEYNGHLFDKLQQASKFIESDEKIRKQLLDERKVLAAQTNGKAADLAKIEKERDAAIAERDALRKKVDDSAAMAKENKNLTAKLTAAEKQISELSKDSGARGKVEQGLRDEAEAVSKKLAAMNDQLKAGQARITELEKQLSDTASATAMATGEIADENALLKSIVLRELQEQAKRQQARKLVEEELEKLQIRSTTLLDKIGALGATEAVLSPKEKKLVNVSAAVVAADQSDFTVVKPMPESDLPPELVARAAEANDLSQKRRFDEARGIYEEIAQKAPKSYLAAVNLGIAQRQLGNYEQAITAFRRALALKRDDSFALTNLGTVEYRSGNLPEAISVLQQAVAADAESYLAHYLLGMALNDKGDHEGARREVKKSLTIKPDYVPAVELAGELGEDSDEIPAPKSAPQTAR
ncbi:MAG: tetratricopeptide repeat protein, partial [Chthoniobacterales bacterium]